MRIILFLMLALSAGVFQTVLAQEVPGCMDPMSGDYTSAATVNNGSCTYPQTSGSLTQKAVLASALEEISGMIHINGKLYALNDGGNEPAIYVLDSTNGTINQSITLGNASNVDWEDLTTDGTYIYVGDFGNNANGARTDLKFYRVSIQSLNSITASTGTVPASDVDIISFRYEDQPDPPVSVPGNSTAFDCEAVVYSDGNLHLFTKNWINYFTTHYILPAEPGTHVALREGSFDTGQILITSATKANDNIVILLGYSDQGFGNCAIWMISGFTNMGALFATGNKRRIDLDNALINGQVESITAVRQTRVLISSEHFLLDPFVDVPQTLYGLNTDAWTAQYVLPLGIAGLTAQLSNHQVVLTWEYYKTGVAYFEVEVAADGMGGAYTAIGRVPANTRTGRYSYTDNNLLVATQRFYRIKVVSPEGRYSYSKTLAVTDSSNIQFNLTVAPNPFNDRVAVSFYSDKRQTVQFSITDLQGRTVMLSQLQCTPGRYNYLIDGLQRLSNGIYILTARTNGNTFVRKIVR